VGEGVTTTPPDPAPRSGPPRLVLLVTSHRVAAGLLTAAAWDLLRSSEVLAPPGHRLLPALAEAGVPVSLLPDEPVPQRARTLHDRALATTRTGPTTLWLVADDGDPGLAQALAPLLALEPAGDLELELVHGSYDVPGARLLDLVAVMDRLRSPGGCPWDAEQTHASLAPYLLEETYEALEAIETADPEALREELGDVLLQVVFHARVAEEDPDRPWSVDDVAAEIVAKLVRRHPHVFSDAAGGDASDLHRRWDELKAQEKRRESVLDGVPVSLPALALAEKYLARAARGGVDVEVEEPDLPDDLTSEQLGALLLGVVSAGRRLGLDAESALREATRAFAGLVRLAEAGAQRSGDGAGG
jgi:XTP/dITP diphosphohydrolase